MEAYLVSSQQPTEINRKIDVEALFHLAFMSTPANTIRRLKVKAISTCSNIRGFHKWGYPKMESLPVVPHKTVAEVANIGNL